MTNEIEIEVNSHKDVPTLYGFDPRIIKYQGQVIYDIRKKLDYSKGTHKILLSGAVGSAKSLLMAHIIVTHCLLYPGAYVGIGRLTMPDLRETLYQMILDHMEGDVDYEENQTRGKITFPNGSIIQCFSWADKKYKKFRSYRFSMFAIEELVENPTDDAYKSILSRLGRMPHVPERLFLSATNPDSPASWPFKTFVERSRTDSKTHVYYSRTSDNPFLPTSYSDDIRQNYTEKEILRLLEGQWVEISGENIYYAYDPDVNYIDQAYEPCSKHPIWISWDFNIGEGKPLSVVLAQEKHGIYHFFNEVVIYGSRTEDSLDELLARKLLDYPNTYIVAGDATGTSRSTSARHSDYEIIEKYLANVKNNNGKRINFKRAVPRSNPPIRTRHNMVNGKCKNALGDLNLYVYKDCVTLDEGLRLVRLKPGGKYIEDDSQYYQHITTAAGYLVFANERRKNRGRQETIQL